MCAEEDTHCRNYGLEAQFAHPERRTVSLGLFPCDLSCPNSRSIAERDAARAVDLATIRFYSSDDTAGGILVPIWLSERLHVRCCFFYQGFTVWGNSQPVIASHPVQIDPGNTVIIGQAHTSVWHSAARHYQ
jgi:hypothetical protein